MKNVDSCGKFIDTKPFKLDNGKLVSQKPTVIHYLSAPKSKPR